ncbi:hypothetical protein [Amycolatopsis panacis]|uniref:Uncharacterized protein n=1 Tax=Amycolatopsis panacis TaxID=2340917 RepID=A0A419I7F3_9PSEU|nr:hypothetical protein [Amycolatopsis panacis]RJQ87815.1 hypothetical protein D5S19_08305 [Amycolatopsis panacis]
MSGGNGAPSPERTPLFEQDPKGRRRRLWSGIVGVLIVAAAFGGIAGLIGGRVPGLVTAGVIGLPLVYVVLFAFRRRIWLEGTELVVRTWGVRRVDLMAAPRVEVVVTDVRGTRTVGLLVHAGHRRRSVKLDVAAFAGTGGRELGPLVLRRLADALLNNTEANGLVFSELLVAELRAEARGDAVAERPLYRFASAAPSGRYLQRFPMEAVSRFVATLD